MSLGGERVVHASRALGGVYEDDLGRILRDASLVGRGKLHRLSREVDA